MPLFLVIIFGCIGLYLFFSLVPFSVFGCLEFSCTVLCQFPCITFICVCVSPFSFISLPFYFDKSSVLAPCVHFTSPRFIFPVCCVSYSCVQFPVSLSVCISSVSPLLVHLLFLPVLFPGWLFFPASVFFPELLDLVTFWTLFSLNCLHVRKGML